MNAHRGEPKALFLSPDGNIYPATLICSGILPAELNGKPCSYSQAGRIPDPLPLNPDEPKLQHRQRATDEEPRRMEFAATKTKSACADCN